MRKRRVVKVKRHRRHVVKKRQQKKYLDIPAVLRMLGHAHLAIGVHTKDWYYQQIGQKC